MSWAWCSPRSGCPHEPYRFQLRKYMVLAVERLYIGQFVYCGKKAQLAIGNVPSMAKPEGTVKTVAEDESMDQKMTPACGCSCIVVGHSGGPYVAL